MGQLQGTAPEQRTTGAARGPRQFLSAALVALSADDLGPLMAFSEVDFEILVVMVLIPACIRWRFKSWLNADAPSEKTNK